MGGSDIKIDSVREATEEEIGRGTCGTGFFKLEVAEGELDDEGDLPPARTLH